MESPLRVSNDMRVDGLARRSARLFPVSSGGVVWGALISKAGRLDAVAGSQQRGVSESGSVGFVCCRLGDVRTGGVELESWRVILVPSGLMATEV